MNRKFDTAVGGTTATNVISVDPANNPANIDVASIGDPLPPTGALQDTFPWLTWNDRPYVSHLELMMVPASSPSRLLYEFGSGQPNPLGGANPPLPTPHAGLSEPRRSLLRQPDRPLYAERQRAAGGGKLPGAVRAPAQFFPYRRGESHHGR